MKKLMIFCYKYPFSPPVEQFLNMEIPYHNDSDMDIVLIPYARDINKVDRYDITRFKNILVKCIQRPKLWKEIVWGVSEIFLNTEIIWQEIVFLIKNKAVSKKNTSFLFTFAVQYFALYKEIKRAINLELLPKQSEILLYSYWLNPMSVAICLYKKYLNKMGYHKVYTVSRAHGQGDLYLEIDSDFYRPGIALLKKEMDLVYSISEGGMRCLKRQGLTKIKVSRLGVDIPKIKINKDTINHDKLIVSCSVINKNKRVIDIARAISALTIKVRWVHFGSGEEEATLIRWCKQNMPDNIEWIIKGWTPNKEIIAYYLQNSPDAFINLSHIEGIPVSIMEAMSCGIPCIATDVGSSGEIVKTGINGFLVSKDFKTEEVTEAIEKCIDEPSIKLKKGAFQSASAYYCAEKNFQEFARDIWKIRRK